MAADPTDSLERMSRDELIGLVRELLGEVARLRADNERLSAGLSKLQVEYQAVKDELARLKGLPPRPPVKPSGMEKAMQAKGTDGEAGKKDGRSTRRRGSLLDRLTISNTVVIKAAAPTGSRHKGYEDIVVQDLNLQVTVTCYRRERWETPAGENIVAELAPGIIGVALAVPDAFIYVIGGLAMLRVLQCVAAAGLLWVVSWTNSATLTLTGGAPRGRSRSMPSTPACR